jgi:hypothetical protein
MLFTNHWKQVNFDGRSEELCKNGPNSGRDLSSRSKYLNEKLSKKDSENYSSVTWEIQYVHGSGYMFLVNQGNQIRRTVDKKLFAKFQK